MFNMLNLFSIFVVILCLASASTGIFDAVSREDIASMQRIIKSQPDQFNTKGPGGQTPLMNAVLSGKTKAVEVLLKAGADVTIPEKDGYTPMHGAGFQGRPEIAKLLIDHGVPFTEEHSDGYLPFHRACWGEEQRHTDTVKVFLEAGIFVRQPASSNGKTCWQMTKNKETKKLLKTYTAKLPPKQKEEL